MSAKTTSESENRKLSNLINYFELCNKSEGRSAKKVSWYSVNLRRFHQYLRSWHLPDSIQDMDIQTLRQYILFLQNIKKSAGHPNTPTKKELLSVSSVHGYVRNLRVFFSWLVREGFLEVNPCSNLKPPKLPKRIVATLSDEEISLILNTLNPTNACDYRNRTIFMILIDTGLRIKELTNLTIADLNLDQGVLKVMDKGQKE
jgi:site-specific recombinase XerD